MVTIKTTLEHETGGVPFSFHLHPLTGVNQLMLPLTGLFHLRPMFGLIYSGISRLSILFYLFVDGYR